MTINTDFPFTHCESCPECVLRVTTSILYGDDRIAARILNVSCGNAALCRRLEDMINETKTSTDPIDE